MEQSIRREPKLLSVVAPVFNEEELVEAFVQRAVRSRSPAALRARDRQRRQHATRRPTLLNRIAEADPRVRVMHLSRNFGHQAALTAGLEHAVGDVVAMIDADLQDPPELIETMIDEWRRGFRRGLRGAREPRRRDRLQAGDGVLVLQALRQAPQIDLEPNSGDFRLLDRRALDALLSMTERIALPARHDRVGGFTQSAVQYEREARHAGETKYTLRQMLRFSLDAIASFSICRCSSRPTSACSRPAWPSSRSRS